MRSHEILLAPVFVVALLGSATPGTANVTQGFDGVPAGTVVLGASEGHQWPDFTVSAVTNYGGPQAVIVFDSSNPTGGDDDLGTPNADFGGPGVGLGGKWGMPGENAYPLGNLLVIAESVVDANGDGLVDVPDDEASGGCIMIDFHDNVVPVSVTLVDVDPYSAATGYVGGAYRIRAEETLIGDNAVTKIDLPNTGFQRLEICFTASGAIAEIEYAYTTSVDETTWGKVKSLYR